MSAIQTKLDALKSSLQDQLSAQFSDEILSLGLSQSEQKASLDSVRGDVAKVRSDLDALVKVVAAEAPVVGQVCCPKCAWKFSP